MSATSIITHIRSSGGEIALAGDNSTISLNNENDFVLVNDSVIDLSQTKIEPDQKNQMNEVVIPYGKKSELLLADGTKVWLNAGSRLAFPQKFTEKNREVFFQQKFLLKLIITHPKRKTNLWKT